MPELPEAERARALIEDMALGRRIASVDDTDTWVCRPHAPGEIAAALEGATLTSAHRRGKTMWVATDRGPTLGLHLGMSGLMLIDSKPSPNRWDRFSVEFEDGGRMAMRDKRRLGRVILDPDLSRLGPDAADATRREFRERIGRGATPLKARLMDQSVVAGLGNLIVDEVLWQARMSPLRPAGDLSEDELDELRRVVRAVVRRSIRRGGAHTGDLNPHRERDGVCPRCGTPLDRATIGGRTTYWCPTCQPARR